MSKIGGAAFPIYYNQYRIKVIEIKLLEEPPHFAFTNEATTHKYEKDKLSYSGRK